jgi:hypothetical protein
VDVIAAQHGAQEFRGLLGIDEGRAHLALGHGGKKTGLHVGSLVHARRHAMGQQFHQEVLFPYRRILEHFHQLGHLLGIEGEGGQAFLGAFFDVLAIGCQHMSS